MFAVTLPVCSLLSPVGFIIRLQSNILFPLLVLQHLSDSHDSVFLNKLLKGWLLYYPVRKQKQASQGTLFCSTCPCLLSLSFCPCFFSSSVLTSHQTDLLPGGFPVFWGSVQQGGDSGCERHHFCRTPQCKHSGTYISMWFLDNKHTRACLFCTIF